MMTSLMCMRCNEVWSDQGHRCPPTPAETERELVEKVVEAAVAWRDLTSGKVRHRGWLYLAREQDLGAAVDALQAHREAR